MEHQALQQQQYVTIEGIDNSNARALVVKLINVLLTVLQVILLLVATCAGIIMPFLRTRLDIIVCIITVLITKNYRNSNCFIFVYILSRSNTPSTLHVVM